MISNFLTLRSSSLWVGSILMNKMIYYLMLLLYHLLVAIPLIFVLLTLLNIPENLMNESDDDILKDRDYATILLKFLVIVLEDLNSKLYQSTRNIIKT